MSSGLRDVFSIFAYVFYLFIGEGAGVERIVSVAWWLASVVGMWATFERCSVDGWKALVPVYNGWCVAKCATSDERYARRYLVATGVSVLSVIAFALCIASGGSDAGWIMLPWTLLAVFASIVFAFVVNVSICVRLARAFGRDGSFAVGLVLLPSVFYCILGFDRSTRYLGPQE